MFISIRLSSRWSRFIPCVVGLEGGTQRCVKLLSYRQSPAYVYLPPRLLSRPLDLRDSELAPFTSSDNLDCPRLPFLRLAVRHAAFVSPPLSVIATVSSQLLRAQDSSWQEQPGGRANP